MLNFVVFFVFAATYSTTAGLNCYQCRNVRDPSDCKIVTTCAQDEYCSIENYFDGSGSSYYSMGCLRKHPCIEATRFLIENEQLFQSGHIVGKRSNSVTCSVCCGSSLCNTGSCFTLIEKLRESWKAGRLDIATLTYKAMNLQ